MKHIFIDTNIIIDFVSQRKPFGLAALLLFNLADKKKIKLYASSHAIATAHYILKKVYRESELRKLLDQVMDYLEIIPVTVDILRKAARSQHKDFEDAVQILCAVTIKNVFAIATRNVADFTKAGIPVYTPDEVLELIK
ncbi:type II toxin-antitoxin system VapC family toxin [Niabella ginsengisoli]|uniref:PIN domain-containing protein n=1 Tax=Niabella ginsengisoli TaxID=522298 RepID=A0ABS9SPU6_9BACT|nr:PIN domain-containing protein [Niabella ginsengisoli]MCH5600418.1 PIN domain-containing protein [Niabella ginsengisoli]